MRTTRLAGLLVVLTFALFACGDQEFSPADQPVSSATTAAPTRLDNGATTANLEPAATAAPALQDDSMVSTADEGRATASALPDLGGREVTIGVENNYVPFNYPDPETGEPVGWDYAVWDEICRLLNCVPVYVETTWRDMLRHVAAGRLDTAANGITITAERSEVVDFSAGYVVVEQRLMVRRGEDRIESIQDLVDNPDLTLGAQVGTTNYETALAYLPEERLVDFAYIGHAALALASGTVDAVIVDGVSGQPYGCHSFLAWLGPGNVTGDESGARIRFPEELKFVGPPLSSDELGFAFPKGSPLVEPVNAALGVLRQSGFLSDSNLKYFGPAFDF